MKKTSIVIDSTAYLPKTYIEENNITVVPLSVELDGKIEEEGLPGNFDDYFERLENTDSFPKTSQPPVGRFKEVYEELFAAGAERILVIPFSSKLSGTYNSAKLAADLLEDRDIVVVDTLAAVGILSHMVKKSVDMINSNCHINEIISELEAIRNNYNVDLTVDSLEYLKRGGRLTNIQAMLAGMLNIRPVISLRKGELVGNGKYRGRKKAIKEMLERVPENPIKISLQYAKYADDALKLKKKLEEDYLDTEIVIEELGPVIGSHLGPNALGICTVYKEK